MKIDANKETLKKLQSELNDYKAQVGHLPETMQILYDNLKIVKSFENKADIVKFQIYNVLSFLSDIDIVEIKDISHLHFDLGLSNGEKWILKRKFNKILENLDSKNFVTEEECSKLKYVSECIKLVNSKL